MSYRALLGLLLLSLPQISPAVADGPVNPAREDILLKRCEIEYEYSSRVGISSGTYSNTTILQDCYVRRGDQVLAGQVLGRIMDRDLQVEREKRRADALSDLDLRTSETKYEQAHGRQKRSEALQRRGPGYMSDEEYNSQKLETRSAALDVEQAKRRRQMAQLQLQELEVMIHAREYVSPHDGVVVEVLKKKGESLNPAEPVFLVVDVNHLKVTGHLNLRDYWRIKPGQRVRVTPQIDGTDLPVEQEKFTGRVVFIDRRIDPATRTCEIIAEVENRHQLLAAGIEAYMEIFPGSSVDSAALPGPN